MLDFQGDYDGWTHFSFLPPDIAHPDSPGVADPSIHRSGEFPVLEELLEKAMEGREQAVSGAKEGPRVFSL